jgi:transposase InsO family protein
VYWDNAAAESFFAALKNEMYHRETFTTRARARFAVADYIEVTTTANGCTQPSATAPQPKRSPTTNAETRRNNQPRNCPRSLTQTSVSIQACD